MKLKCVDCKLEFEINTLSGGYTITEVEQLCCPVCQGDSEISMLAIGVLSEEGKSIVTSYVKDRLDAKEENWKQRLNHYA